MRRKRHLYDSSKLNLSQQPSMTDRQKSFNNSDSGSFVKDEHSSSKRNILPLQMPMIPTFVADLTPTPTRFLRSCEEVGLFNEISKGSYNEDFKRESSTCESNSVLSSLPSQSQAPIPSVILESIADDNEAEDSDSAAALQDQSASNFAISMIEASSQQQQLIYNAPQESTADTPAEVVILEPAAERPHIQVLLQLPQGGFFPINIPADALAHATFPSNAAISVESPVRTVITPLVVAPRIASTTSSTSGITSTTKQKLKAAVQQNIQQQQQQLIHQQQQHPHPIAMAPASMSKVALPDVSSSSSHGSGPSVSKTPKLSVNMTPPDIVRSLSQPLSSPSSEDDEGDEKRKKFLESNRAAANRCRQKKKQWINTLEEKTKQLQEVNRSLTNETSQLRREITHLKQVLSQHKDCPPPLTIVSSNVRTDSNF